MKSPTWPAQKPCRWFLSLLVAFFLAGCASSGTSVGETWPEAVKLRFRWEGIHPDGLRGPPDGLVSVAYEFCIPADERIYAEVRRIDPSVQIAPGSRGRIGCGAGQALCLGSTHQPHWREVLQGLTRLGYVTEIRECFFE